MKHLVAILFLLLTPFASQTAQSDVDRGRYLVHSVAMCVQCHTPRDGHGNLVTDKLLHGEAIPFAAPFQDTPWAARAPHIAGLPGYSEEQALKLLTEGVTATGGTPKLPMPPFRMAREDAKAVVAYLKSLR